MADLLGDLQGYKNSIEFIKILQKYKTNKVKIVDLNYIFNIFTGITKIQSELANIIGWKKSYHAKIKILNAWRTMPFIDIIEVINIFEKNGPAMLLDSVTSIPSGTDPESFFKISNFEEIEIDEVKSIVQATAIFMPLALSFGLPMWIEHDEGSTAKPYYEELREAGHRAINIVQPLRIKKLQIPRWGIKLAANEINNRRKSTNTIPYIDKYGLKPLQFIKQMQSGQAAGITEVEMNEVADASKHPAVLLKSLG